MYLEAIVKPFSFDVLHSRVGPGINVSGLVPVSHSKLEHKVSVAFIITCVRPCMCVCVCVGVCVGGWVSYLYKCRLLG